MSDHEQYVAELLGDTLEVLHRLETLLDRLVDVAEDIEDATAESAYYSRGFLWRWTFGLRHRKLIRRIAQEHDEFVNEFASQLKFPG